MASPQAEHIYPDYIIPLSPAIRPPIQHYHSASTLPPTPHTPYRGQPTSRDQFPGSGPNVHQSTTLRPYLTLAPRLLLATVSPALLPLVLSIAHLLQNRSSTASLADTLRASLLSACAGLAKGAASLQTLPRYIAMKTNEQMIRTSQAMILAVGTGLMDIITIINVVVEFMVDTYRSMLLCTIELAVRGTLEVMIEAIRTITEGVTSSLNLIRESIQNDVASANRFIRSTVERNLFNANLTIPELNIPSLSGLENVQISTDFEDSLVRLNSTLPSLSEIQDKMAEILAIPFDRLKLEINETRIELAASLNTSILPTPALASLSTQHAMDLERELCSDLDTSVIDETAKALHKMSTVAIGLMFLMLFFCWAVLCIWEWRRYRAMQQAAQEIEREWREEKTMDVYRVVAIVENPVLEHYGSKILERVAPNERTRLNLRWYMAYLAHPTCLALLCVAVLGFAMLQFQILALNGIKAHARANANSTVAATSSSLAAKMNAMAAETSADYARDFNAVIARHQQRIDDELFGKWINTTAITLNATVGEFYDDIENALNATFGGTILFNPMNTFLYCILGSKVDNLQAALDWLSIHARVTLPTVPENILMLSDESMAEVASPIAAAAVGSSTGDGDDDQGVVGRLIEHFESALIVERIFYAIILGVWLCLAIIGLLIVVWHSGGKNRYQSWRGTNPGDLGEPSGSARQWPWNNDKHPIYDKHAENGFRGLASSSDTPEIIEPESVDRTNHCPGRLRTSASFLDTSSNTVRPAASRKSTFGGTSSIMAPGQAFLERIGRPTTEDDENPLLEKGQTSEMYCETTSNPLHRDFETPPPFWVNRFYGGLKSLFPTRGQSHGAALRVHGSKSVNQSFEMNLETSSVASQGASHEDEARYTVARPHHNSNPFDDPSRMYPPHPATNPIYPRPLSRAATLLEGAVISQSATAPRLSPNSQKKHDSVDYLNSELEPDNPYDDTYHEENLRSHHQQYQYPLDSPDSSSHEYFATGPVMGNAQRVNVHRTASDALAEIISRKQIDVGTTGRYF